MPLDAKGRKKRARKAGKASGKARSEKTKDRDPLIVAAYKRLSGLPQPKDDEIRAIQYLQSLGCGVNRPKDKPVLRFLADATGLTRQRIWQIVKKPDKQT